VAARWRGAPGARATLARSPRCSRRWLAGTTNVVGLAGAAVFAACASLPIAFSPRPERAGRRVLSGVAAALAFACVLPFAARELEALAIAQPARAEAEHGGAALQRSRAAEAWRAAKLWPHDDVLWRLASDASLAEARALADTAAVPTAMVAERAARRALELEPMRATNLERVADALGERALRARSGGLADSAHALFDRASAMAPADGWLLVSWIRFELARRDGARALDAAQRLARMYPEAAVGHALSGAALLLLGRTDEARESLLRARAARWEEDAGAQRAELERLLAQLGPAPAGSGSGPPPRR
jgi:tetratricopeptide (TPR) repeat protein